MSARLRLQEQGEGRIPGDVDPLDRIHLDGDVERHVSPSLLELERECVLDMEGLALRVHKNRVAAQGVALCGPGVARQPGRCGAAEASSLGLADRGACAASRLGRAFTSTKATVSPRAATMSISAPGIVNLRARMR